MKARVQVTIPDTKYIPTIGKGPINRPISITVDQYNMLVKFGFNIVKVEHPKLDKIEKIESKVEEKPVEEVKEVEVTEPAVEEEVAETIEEPVQEEESTEEVVEETTVEEVVTDEAYTMEDLEEATKDELKEILEKRNKKFPYNANLGKLKELVVESNPK